MAESRRSKPVKRREGRQYIDTSNTFFTLNTQKMEFENLKMQMVMFITMVTCTRQQHHNHIKMEIFHFEVRKLELL